MKILSLVIGNNIYPGKGELDNPINDATGIAKIFEQLGYDVLLKTNCKTSDYSDILQEFENKIQDYDACIFYYAGHGFQFEGENYLTSIESQIEHPNKHELERSSIRLTEIFEIIKKSNTSINIMIIDACRKSFERGGLSGFSNVSVPKGTIVAFSTSPLEGSNDKGFENNSVYTGALLKYLGREQLSVEELFKKVRKTVYNMTGGKQTTWEHTSLIGDFYFNTGQMVYSKEIPYGEKFVKDSKFEANDSKISKIIEDLRSLNWYKQNPAIDNLSLIDFNEFNKDELFLIGRNILQSAGYANNSTNFIENLEQNLEKYFNSDGENHLLNGILFEIYFDSNGNFRMGNFKKNYYDTIFNLRKKGKFSKSFDFINDVLTPFKEYLFYIPKDSNDKIIDIDVYAVLKEKEDGWSENKIEVQQIQLINTLGVNITKEISRYNLFGATENGLKNTLANYLFVPLELVHIVSNIDLKKIYVKYESE